MNKFEDISEPQVVIELVRGYRLEIAGGKLLLSTSDGKRMLSGAFASAAFRNLAPVSTLDPSARMQGGEDEIRIEIPGSSECPGMEWLIAWERRSPIIRIIQVINNTTSGPIQLDQLIPLQTSQKIGGVEPAELEVYSPGYMSWSAHSMGRLAGLEYRQDRVLNPMIDPTMPDGIPMAWLAHIKPEGEDAQRMLIGFTQSYRHVGIVEMGTQRGGLIAWNDGEGVTLLPGERRQSEELLILLDFDRNDALSKYAFEVARRKGYRKKPSERPPVGWNSGPAFFENVSWQDIMENLKAASRLKRRMPLDYFLLDDFYTTVGDWLDLRDRYLGSDAGLGDGSSREQVVSRRMQGLVQMIRQQSLTAGLWLAPLLVNAQSKLFHRLGERSEWLLHDEYGDPVNAVTHWGGPNYVLDVTHPQVEAHLRRVIRTVAHVWGFKTLKLDYMFAGALHGARRERDLTSVEAYNYFLKMVREEAMDARIILSGAPFIESAGGDYIRIGPSLADRSGPAWNPTESDVSMPSASNSVRESLSRAFWLETLFGNVDADSLVLRLGQDSRLTPPERDSIIAAVRATNSVVSLGDDLLELGDYARNLILHAFSPSCEAGRPIAFDENGRPTVMQVHVSEDQQEITFFNWKDEEDELEFDPDRFDGLGGWHFAIEDVLSAEWLGVGKGNISFVIPPHGSKILRILKVTIPDQESGSGTLSSSDQDLV